MSYKTLLVHVDASRLRSVRVARSSGKLLPATRSRALESVLGGVT